MGAMFSYLSPEERVPADHHLRAIRVILDRSSAELDGYFNQMYSDLDRSSIPPEYLLRALRLQASYSVGSEQQLMEQVNYHLLFRSFVDLGMDDQIWVPTVFTMNRDRLLDNGTVQHLFQVALEQARH